MNTSVSESSRPELILSVCVVCYNHELYIKECMDHILEQEMDFPYEIIVGNDCSTDHTADVLEAYADRAVIINRVDNMGLCANLYDLFLRAKGKYVFNFSGDDYLCDRQALKKQVKFLEENPEYYAVSAWNYMYRESNHQIYENYDDSCPREFTMEDFLREGHIPTTHGMMRNSFYEDRSSNQYLVSGARNNEEMKLWTYTLSKGKRYILPEYLHVYRNVDREGMSNYNSTHTIFDMFKDNYIDLCILRSLFKGKYNFTPVILKRSNYYLLKLSKNMSRIMSVFKELSMPDRIRLLWYKVYLKIHDYKDPAKWSKKEYLIPMKQ